MKKHEIIVALLKIPLDIGVILLSFIFAKYIREIGDFIPGIQLPSHAIDTQILLYYALFGVVVYCSIFFIHGLYKLKITASRLKEILDILRYSVYFFLFFSVFVYFGKGVLYQTEIPRLIILYATIFSAIGMILHRIIINKIWYIVLEKKPHLKRKLLLITTQSLDALSPILEDINNAHIYEIVGYFHTKKTKLPYPHISKIEELKQLFATKKVDEILFIDSHLSPQELYQIWDISRIYGVRYRYIPNAFDITKTNTTVSLINQIPVVEIQNMAIGAWGRVIKRVLDIIFSSIALIVFFPFFIIIGIAIKLEDPSGPVIFKNTRIGQNEKPFTLYKFRYLKWKYSIKEGYGVKNSEDSALAYEKKLIKEKSKRSGPLYKIENDPRKTRIGTRLEKYSIDELPQLFNVLLGNMSLIGPRPHQPREVENYKLSHKRVLTIKPGITGIAQVNGRDKNTFEDEVNLDIFYIENWSLLLDMKIFFKTFAILFNRK